MDPHWSETGNRYLLKLFRDYVFHQTHPSDARPVLNLAHGVASLNKLDTGSPERVVLVSENEQNLLVVSFADLKRCLDESFSEIVQQQHHPRAGSAVTGRR